MSAREMLHAAESSERDEAAFFESVFGEAPRARRKVRAHGGKAQQGAAGKSRARGTEAREDEAQQGALGREAHEDDARQGAAGKLRARTREAYDADAKPGGRMLRAFFAVPLSDELRARIANVIDTLRAREHGAEVRWVRAENLHITLRFLGSVAEASVPALADAAVDALRAAAPVEFSLSAPQRFPAEARAPKWVALACEPSAAFAALAARLSPALEAFHVKRAEPAAAFRAHITLGRLRARRCPELAGAPPLSGVFRATQVQLFHSELAAEGARYHALASVALVSPAASAHGARTAQQSHPTTTTPRPTENDHGQD